MADNDGFVIDIFSNEDDFGQVTSTRKVSTKKISGLSMVSGYATDDSGSISSLKMDGDSRTVLQEQEEDGIDQNVVPMEIEDLEEGEYLSDFNPEAELELIYDKEQEPKEKGREVEVSKEEDIQSKQKKKEKKNKKKKKKDKGKEKKKDKVKDERKVKEIKRSDSKEGRHHRRSSFEIEHKESKRDKSEQLSKRGREESEKYRSGSRKHSSRSPKREREREWERYKQTVGKSQVQEDSSKHSRRHRSSEKEYKDKKKGDIRRVERDSSLEGMWERRVKVVNKEGSSGSGRKHKSKIENITIAIDQRVPKEKKKQGKHEKQHEAQRERHVSRGVPWNSDLDSEGDYEKRTVLIESSKKKDRKKEKPNEKIVEHKEAFDKRGRNHEKRREQKASDGVDIMGSVEGKVKEKKKKKKKKVVTDSVERKKEKKKKKKKRQKESKKEEQSNQTQRKKVTGDLVSEGRLSTSSDLLVDRSESNKDLHIEMQKDREFNTLDQRLQEIERRLALDTDISSDENDHDPKLGDLAFSESESRDKPTGFSPVDIESFEDVSQLVTQEESVDEKQIDPILRPPIFEPEEEELSGEALFMKEYGLELEDKSEAEEMGGSKAQEGDEVETTEVEKVVENVSGPNEEKPLESIGPSGFIPAFGLASHSVEQGTTRELLGKGQKKVEDTTMSKWKPVGGFSEVEEISEDENSVHAAPLVPTLQDENDENGDVGDAAPIDETNEDVIKKLSSGLYESVQALEEISDQEDIFDSIEQEEKSITTQRDVSPEAWGTSKASQSTKWKPIGLTQVKAVSQQLLLTPSDEYCEFQDTESKAKTSPKHHGGDGKRSRRKSGSEHKDSHRHRKEHRDSDSRHRRTSEKERESKHSKHHEGHHHSRDAKHDRHLSGQDVTLEERLAQDKESILISDESHQKTERTADKYKKKPARKEGKVKEKAVEDSAVRPDREHFRRSKSREKDDLVINEFKKQETLESKLDKRQSTTPEPKDVTPLFDNEIENVSSLELTVHNRSEDAKEQRHGQVESSLREEGRTRERKDSSEKSEASSKPEKGSEMSKEKRLKRPLSKEHENHGKVKQEVQSVGAEVRPKKKKRESVKKPKDDLFDDIFGGNEHEEEAKDDMANLLKEPEPFRRVSGDFEKERILERSKPKEKHHRKKTEEKLRKKEARRKRESESTSAGEALGKVSKLDSRKEPEKIPGIMDGDITYLGTNNSKESSDDGISKGIPLLFDSLPKADLTRSNSEEKENDSTSLFKGSTESRNEVHLESHLEMSPYNPEDLSPIDLNESPQEDYGLHGDSIAMAIESIEKKRETILANLNYETIMREKAREHVRQRKSDSKGESTHATTTAEAPIGGESMVDHLIRQSRVEDEMKTVLKEYYKKKEISKEEYKNILKKAVPQVTMSNSPIIPEKIRNLMKKFVCKAKGQRILNEKKSNDGAMSRTKRKGYYKNFKPPKLPEPKPKDKKNSSRTTSSHSMPSGPGSQLKILNPNLPMPPVL